jgi:hypothetical protein
MIKEIVEELSALNKKYSVLELIDRKAIPVDRKLMDELGYLEEDVIAYHVTNERHLPGLIKNQKKDYPISTFTRGGGDLLTLPSQPNIVVKLKGDALITGASDIWTLVDENGMRWINQDGKEKTKLSFFISGIINSLLRKRGLNTVYEVKDVKKFYKEYVDKLLDYLDHGGYRELNKFLNNKSKRYNEIILTNFVILKVSSINIDNPSVKKLCEKHKIPYDVMDISDLAKIS